MPVHTQIGTTHCIYSVYVYTYKPRVRMFTNTVECAPRGQGKQQMMRDDVAQSVLQPVRAEGETK